MSGLEPPEPVRLWDLERLEACPASLGPGSELPKPQLERWKSVYEAIVDWHVQGEPDSEPEIADICHRMFAVWDAVQRRILEDLFAAYRRLHPSGSKVVLDPPSAVFIDDASNLCLNVGVQVEVETENGWEAVRIKTGKEGTSPVEAAAYYTPGEEKTLVDVMLAQDDRVTVAPPDSEYGQKMLRDLFDRHARAVTVRRGVRNPGLYCYSCPRPARCGQYPVLGGDVSYRTRTIRVSKSRLADLARCERSAAWPALDGIPKDNDQGDEIEDSHGLRVGSRFHDTVAAALLAEHPEELFEAACSAAPPSEASDLRYLFDQHLDLWSRDSHPVAPVRTEYQMGVTLLVAGQVLDNRENLQDGPVAVAMMCATDVNGWEDETTAAVVEHRTGGASAPLPHEADLYAVSTWAALQQMGRTTGEIAVHFHHLRRTPGECERVPYTPDQIEAAIQRLRQAAEVIAAWHPSNALSPRYSVGPQCDWCERRTRCQQYR